MQPIIYQNIEDSSFELVIDTKIFEKEVILKAAFNHIDSGYFIFAYNSDGNIILQCYSKPYTKLSPQEIILRFTDDLLEVALRVQLERDNRVIRETIITKSLLGPIDEKNFSSFDTANQLTNQIDFDKDIDEILKEIENDPDLKIDEEEIDRILKEIEAESIENDKPKLGFNVSAIENVKLKFKK